jgi:hypothetical protein
MRYRKLRIAFSAVCGVFCLLLVALWLSSYQQSDSYAFTVLGYGVMPLNGSLVIRETWRHYLTNVAVYVPIGWLFAATVMCGIAPWLRWRFSLRTLMICIAVTAAALGLIAVTTFW